MKRVTVSAFHFVCVLALVLLFSQSGCAPVENTPPAPVQTDTVFPKVFLSPTPIPTKTRILSPLPPPTETVPPEVRFAVIGDYGLAGDSLAAVAGLVDGWGVDFILTTGDNNYPYGLPETIDENIGQYFHEYIYPYHGAYGVGAEVNRFFPSLGNHDWYTQDIQAYLDYFELPGNERYYSFSWGFIDFFILDSDWLEPDGILPGSVQGQWLQESLAASQAAWQVVCFHLTPYSSGYHGPTEHMRWPFKEWGADVVIAGHDHDYERLEVDGLVYFVNGLGGGARYAVGDPVSGSMLRYQAQHGAMLVAASPQMIEFSFFNVDGHLIDSYILSH